MEKVLVPISLSKREVNQSPPIISLTIISKSSISSLKIDLHLISSLVQLKVFVTLLCGHGIIHACYKRIRACVASACREFHRYARKRENLRKAYMHLSTSYATLR